ncbi:hypothetical protein VaNZ11_004038 [Volvox africanus]|uniref:Retrotransposon gag domain-containing protein n=1 Tax=Volvox africanus TaxID=51714 RepID=A0ABQ5RVI8_9CHLO|nr:hypothetical protein VaNZ11_004038 [Volvox africanus]
MMQKQSLDRWLREEPATKMLSYLTKVKTIMVENVQDYHLAIIRAAVNAKGAWDRIAAIFAANSDARKSQLIAELTALKMEQGEALPIYLARVRNLFTDLVQAGHPVTEREITYNLLVGLTKRFGMIVATLTASGELSLDSVTAQLLAFERRMDVRNPEGESVAFVGTGPRGAWSNGQSNCGEGYRREWVHRRFGGSRLPGWKGKIFGHDPKRGSFCWPIWRDTSSTGSPPESQERSKFSSQQSQYHGREDEWTGDRRNVAKPQHATKISGKANAK